jgi:uroporphyrinogen-III synthase
VLIVRGDGGREWLADTLRARGAQVELLAAYRRRPPVLNANERALLAEALARPRGHCWLFSSSESIDHLEVLAGPDADWSPTRARPRTRALTAGATVKLAQVTLTRTTLAVSACLQSMAP